MTTMISGQVKSQQALIEIEIFAPSMLTESAQAVVDTGYTGYLTLGAERIRSLGLPFAGFRRGQVADGRTVLLEMYLATIRWHGRLHPVLAAQTKGSVLIGMSLLRGSELRIDVVEGGNISIEKRSR